jgi:RHS repeat-associated protein
MTSLPPIDSRPWLRALAAVLALAIVTLSTRSRRRGRAAVAALLAVLTGLPACALIGEHQAAAWTREQTSYLHDGFGVGPALITRADRTIEEERRQEPFGAPVDAYRESPGLPAIGAIDYAAEPFNSLNKPTDPTTGWSYHGARWMASSSARWLTPDPPVKAPNAAALRHPWDLSPYQYADQSPSVYWDPDGRQVAGVAPKLLQAAAKDSVGDDLLTVAGGAVLGADLWYVAPLLFVQDDYSDVSDTSSKSTTTTTTTTTTTVTSAATVTVEDSVAEEEALELHMIAGVESALEEPAETHHICSNKRLKDPSGWTAKFQELFARFGLDLDDPINFAEVPGHFGPHPAAYHEEVYDRLSEAADLGESAFYSELARIRWEIETPNTDLNRMVTVRGVDWK